MESRNRCCIDFKLLAMAMAALLLVACGDSTPPDVADIIRPVKMYTVGSDTNGTTLEYPGVITATRSVELGFEVQGKIIDLPITDGQKVRKGELLSKLDPVDYIAARDAAKSNHHALNSAYQRAKRIFDLGAGSQAEIDLTLRDVRVAREELKTAQKALDDTSLTSPFDGEVAKKIADNFQNVQAKEPILLLQDLSSFEMDVAVPEQDFINTDTDLTPEERSAAANLEIALSAMPEKRLPARFKSFSSAADPVTRTYTVTLAFDKPTDLTVLPGMTAKAIVHIDGEKAKQAGFGGLLVPSVSVASDEQGNAYTWRIDPNTSEVSQVMVTLGAMSGSKVRILSGLQTGDKIAMSGIHYLREGMKVRPLDEQ